MFVPSVVQTLLGEAARKAEEERIAKEEQEEKAKHAAIAAAEAKKKENEEAAHPDCKCMCVRKTRCACRHAIAKIL